MKIMKKYIKTFTLQERFNALQNAMDEMMNLLNILAFHGEELLLHDITPSQKAAYCNLSSVVCLLQEEYDSIAPIMQETESLYLDHCSVEGTEVELFNDIPEIRTEFLPNEGDMLDFLIDIGCIEIEGCENEQTCKSDYSVEDILSHLSTLYTYAHAYKSAIQNADFIGVWIQVGHAIKRICSNLAAKEYDVLVASYSL